ncbi:thioredoxin family protein [bacterium]|nr:thioredoxin family protein [bacterium]
MKKKQADKIGERIGLAVLGFFIIFLAAVGGMYWYIKSKSTQNVAGEVTGPLESNNEEQNYSADWSNKDKERLAKFLAEKGVVLYYGNSCPHCHDQLEMFGEAQKYLKSIDCYFEENMAVCNQAQIEGVPTWKYKGEAKVGVRELDELAKWVGFKK